LPNEDDYKKLTRVMQHLRCTRELTLTIEPGINAQWWVDSFYAVHMDMQSHTGIMMTFGKGVTYSTSFKQNINTKSSMDAELVAVNDAMGQVLSTSFFCQHKEWLYLQPPSTKTTRVSYYSLRMVVAP
jgi:hypothetical protein